MYCRTLSQEIANLYDTDSKMEGPFRLAMAIHWEMNFERSPLSDAKSLSGNPRACLLQVPKGANSTTPINSS